MWRSRFTDIANARKTLFNGIEIQCVAFLTKNSLPEGIVSGFFVYNPGLTSLKVLFSIYIFCILD